MPEIVRARPDLAEAFARFLESVNTPEERAFFAPHPFDREAAERICNHQGGDEYHLMMQGGEVVGYGLLRGWDEGFAVPSLGICIAPTHRGRGLSRILMDFLHSVARTRGCTKVRLKAGRDNARALDLYRSLGYEFTAREGDFLVGFLDLAGGGG